MGFLEGSGDVPACGEAIMVAMKTTQSSILIYIDVRHPTCSCSILSCLTEGPSGKHEDQHQAFYQRTSVSRVIYRSFPTSHRSLVPYFMLYNIHVNVFAVNDFG